ncbi:hypothetical protein FRC08_012806 [Ceratobasidium sp. 394]|nr:hypothetical protein FRC08_012806 [Ceratobasidium sp. 394]KAG9074792.1 hypothetical protein FS749_013619 [Ceratobasidium sp. UAMH 11750]
MSALNSDFNGTGLTFKISEIGRAKNETWYRDEPGAARIMRTKLHQGGAALLNVYTVAISEGGVMARSTLPWSYSGDPTFDGIVIRPGTVGDDSKILTHEVGHWLGLYHTFRNGCEGDGDQVDDTPAEASPSWGCDTTRDTCPGGGYDPVHNHMDYSPSSCRTEFTPGQVTRMKQQIAVYRNIKG